MKYTTTVEIDLSRESVVELFDNQENYNKWQESLMSLELLEGEPGQVGTRTRLVHKMGPRKIDMIETVTKREFPDLFVATYEADNGWNEAINRFSILDEDRTQWTIETEFRFTGAMKLMASLMPSMFEKETQKVMESFKAFAEENKPAQDSSRPSTSPRETSHL